MRAFLVLSTVVLVLAGCGAAHLQTQPIENVSLAPAVRLGSVTVGSQEESAKTNAPLQAKMRQWEADARSNLSGALVEKGYRVLDGAPAPGEDTQTVDLDVDLQYGNRAVRYLVGFGAGKGHVRSKMKIQDSAGKVLFQSGADSDLSMGGFGGDIGAVFTTNIKKLLSSLPAPTP
jgi:hypothetical protein